MKWAEILPVVLSICVIVLVSFLEKYSKMVAAVTATMPLTIPLALWVVYSKAQGERVAVMQFTQNLAIGIFPTVAFTLALWLAARGGIKLGGMLLWGYAAWATTLLIWVAIKRWLGI